MIVHLTSIKISKGNGKELFSVHYSSYLSDRPTFAEGGVYWRHLMALAAVETFVQSLAFFNSRALRCFDPWKNFGKEIASSKKTKLFLIYVQALNSC